MKIGFLLIIAIFFVIEHLEGNFLLVEVGDKDDAEVGIRKDEEGKYP